MQKAINRVTSTFLTHSNPNHLIVIQHGWLAPWIRATPLGQHIAKMATKQHTFDNDNRYLIHIVRSNSNDYVFGWIKTQDGINNGGNRTYNEIKTILDENESITKLSVIGSSLGGLYLRYAIKHLYDYHNKRFYKDIDAQNFVSLGTPHLGVEDWMKHQQKYLYSLAKYLSVYGLLPNTLLQILRLDDDSMRLLDKMANDEEYLMPLSQFKNRLIYANTINDNRVSCSSGLILPSFDTYNEEQLIKDLFIKHIDDATKDKVSIVKPLKLATHSNDEEEDDDGFDIHAVRNGNDKNIWYSNLSDSMEWNRFVVSMNSNYVDKKMAHGLLSNPVPFYKSCVPLLDHLNEHFCW